MRSISFKLVVAFLLVSLTGVLLSVAFARWSTGDAFQRFLLDQSRANLQQVYTDYYQAHGSWVGVETAWQTYQKNTNRPEAPEPDPNRRGPFTLVDQSGQVVLAGFNHYDGELVASSELKKGTPIKVDGQVVGTLLFIDDNRGFSRFEAEFFQRVSTSLAVGGLGAIILAVVLGFILSRTITRPIRELTDATQAISQGNLSLDLPVRSKDELGQLAKSFNRMSSELERSFNLRRQMTADIAHELRTPLSVILGHADGVHDGVLQPTLENFEIIRDEAERLEHLVEDLRTLSLADADELPMNFEPVSPKRLLGELLNIYGHSAHQKNIALKSDIVPDIPDLNLDHGRMVQVFGNLLDNALRYTPEGGQITLAAQRSGDQVEIRVRDSGPGLSPDELAHIFDRFYRADVSRQRQDGGSGLGLAIARSIVEKHHGQIRAESQPGQGTAIIISLPVG
jgi:two-component system sensor histidine kinase BaeS